MAQTFFLCSGLKLHQKPFSALISPPPMIHTEHGAYLALDVDAIFPTKTRFFIAIAKLLLFHLILISHLEMPCLSFF
jgi:hypothetical protein